MLTPEMEEIRDEVQFLVGRLEHERLNPWLEGHYQDRLLVLWVLFRRNLILYSALGAALLLWDLGWALSRPSYQSISSGRPEIVLGVELPVY